MTATVKSTEAEGRSPLGDGATRQPALTAAIFALFAIVFAASIRTPLGVAVWIFYLAPGLLCLFHRSPRLPLWVAGLSTVLIVAGFFISPPDVVSQIVELNRAFGVLSAWLVALLGRRFIIARLRVERESRLREAQTTLNDRLRGERRIEGLAAAALAHACEWLGAQVGALYVVAGDGYELAVARAFDAAEGRGRRFRRGEGLVGQVAADERVVVLTDVPDGYLRIASGLGAATVRALALGPLTASGRVCGVVELGFLDRAPDAAAELLRRISESVGSALQNLQHQERLQAQQEELRATNEELADQARALQESQARLEEQQAELEQTNDHLGEQARALEAQSETLAERNAVLSATQRELIAKTDELSRANRYKSEFLANMSHELRTPLNSTLILSRLLADNRGGNLTAEQVKFAETINAAGNDLLALIDDVLDLSKVEAGRMEVAAESFTVAAVIESLDRTFAPLAADKGLAFTTAAADPGVALHTDRRRLEQILKNLVANAVKFTDRGSVRVDVEGAGDWATFAVADTGIGIAGDQLDAIFEAFKQADGTTNRKHGGSGLGLSIARRLAHLLGGNVTVASEPGRGSVFTLRIPRRFGDVPRPLSDAEEAAAMAQGSARPDGRPRLFADDRERLSDGKRTILLVEDDERFALATCELVRELGFQCLTATTAAAGIALARAHRPHGVVLDVRLPDRSGVSVLDELKRAPETRHIPVHVVSVGDYERTVLELGAVAFLKKPMEPDRLRGALRDLEAAATRPVRQVLVVDDDAALRRALVELIAGDDVHITPVGSGEEALAALAANTFDCMVVDLQLPRMSGEALLARLAESGGASHPPVIVYTGRDLAREDEERLQRYASTIVLKGARSPERLLSEVALFLHRVEERMPGGQRALLQSLRARERALDGRTLLLVDDDVRNVFALSSVLEGQGARVRVARNGREALDELARDGAVDLVLMDIMMPEMNGYDAMAGIRAQPRFAGLPIIAVTARAMPDDHERCLRAGANDYIAKPVDVEQLTSLVRVWTASRRRWLS